MPTPLDQVLSSREHRLRQLPPLSCALIAAACAERLVPAYEQFRRETGWDADDRFRWTLDQVWAHLTSGQPPQLPVDIALALTPHGADYDSPFTTAAQDACICLGCAIDLMHGDTRGLCFPEYVGEAHRSLMEDDRWWDSGSEQEQRLCESDGFRREIEALDADLADAGTPGHTTLDTSTLEAVRQRARTTGIQWPAGESTASPGA